MDYGTPLDAFGLLVLDSAIVNICRPVARCKYIKACVELGEQPKQEEDK